MSTSNSLNRNSTSTPPGSPSRNSRTTQNSSPRRAITVSIAAWRSLEIKLGEVIGSTTQYDSSPAVVTPVIIAQPSVSQVSIVDSDSTFFRQSSSSGSLYLTCDDLTSNAKTTKSKSKLKANFFRLRSSSTSSSTPSTNSTMISPPPSTSKRSLSSSRRAPIRDTSTSRSASATIKRSTSSISLRRDSRYNLTLPSSPPTSKYSSTTSPILPPSPPLSIPKLRKAQSLIQLSSSWFKKTESPPLPPLPKYYIPKSPALHSLSTTSSSSTSSSPTVINTPALLSNPSAASTPSLSSSTPASNGTPQNHQKGTFDLFSSISNRFRPSNSTSNKEAEPITDEELKSWRKEDAPTSTPIGERIILSNTNNRFFPAEEEDSEELLGLGVVDLEDLDYDSLSTNSNSTAAGVISASSVGMMRNVSLPSSRLRPPPMLRSSSTSSLPTSNSLAVPGSTRTLVRKLSFTPISIPASKGPTRRIELSEAFPLPPIRL